jgi:hypothetical protein
MVGGTPMAKPIWHSFFARGERDLCPEVCHDVLDAGVILKAIA